MGRQTIQSGTNVECRFQAGQSVVGRNAMQSHVLRWDKDLTVYTVGKYWDEARDALEQGTPLHMELGEVEEIDALGLQLLLAVTQAAGHKGIPVTLGKVSAPIIDVLNMLELEPPVDVLALLNGVEPKENRQ